VYAARALPSFDWNEPSSRIITENFLEVVVTAEAEAPLVRSAPEYRGAERLQRGPVLANQITVITEQRNETHSEHDRNKKQKQNMKSTHAFLQTTLKMDVQSRRNYRRSICTYSPKVNEIGQRR
jgi:hypothetical protein